MEPESDIAKPQPPTAQSRAEQLLALRAPLIERGKKVPALERSIAAHEVEANALHALLRSATLAEKVLLEERDETRREVDIARLEADLVRERLRLAEADLAKVTDRAHARDTAHGEEITRLRNRCAALKRKIENLGTAQNTQLERKVWLLEEADRDFRREIAEITRERDEWREKAIDGEKGLHAEAKAKQRGQTLTALLETERTLTATLRKELEDAEREAKKAKRENAKQLNPREAGKEKVEKALHAEKEKSAALKQKLKDAGVAAKKMKREEASIRQKCQDLEKRLGEALTRAVKSEERAADLEKRPATRSRGIPSPGHDALMSPAPLAFGKRPAEDVASESRSRFTATLPPGVQDDNDTVDLPVEPSLGQPTPSPRSKRKKARPQKLAPPPKPGKKRNAITRGKADSESMKGTETKKRRRTGSGKESNGPTNETSTPTSTPTKSPAPGNVMAPVLITPRRKHGKAPRKTPTSSPARRLSGPPRDEQGESEVPRRTLRSRKPVSYNYDEEGRDLVNSQPGFEVDYAALRRSRAKRSGKRQKTGVVSRLEFSEAAPCDSVSPSGVRKPRLMETVRKQVPVTRDVVK